MVSGPCVWIQQTMSDPRGSVGLTVTPNLRYVGMTSMSDLTNNK
jgi:hypothetical protein